MQLNLKELQEINLIQYKCEFFSNPSDPISNFRGFCQDIRRIVKIGEKEEKVSERYAQFATNKHKI